MITNNEIITDREKMLEAVKNKGYALNYANDTLKADREFVLAVVAKRGYALLYASAELRADREVVLAAVAKYGSALEYALKELRADREVVLAAVAEQSHALKHASKHLRADRYIVNFAKSTRSQKLWKLLTVRFFVILFVKKLQRRIEKHERVDFEKAWDANSSYLAVGVSERVTKAIFQHGWEEAYKRQRRR